MVTKKTKKTVKPPTFGPNTIRIRMYRIGFGDCFLVSLPDANQLDGDTHKHILVDCGVHAQGDLDMIDRAADHIAETTGKKLAIVIATHSHQDHISGFSNKFTSFEIGEVWLPWCEDPDDKQAAKLTKKHAALAEKLEQRFAVEARTARVDKTRAAAIAAVKNLVQNKTALGLLRSGFNVGADVHYFSAGKSLKNPAGVQGLSVRFLGPPRDEKFLSKMDPPSGHSYLSMTGRTAERLHPVTPFADRWEVDVNDPSIAHLRFSTAAADALQKELATPSLNALAFALDNYKNNTSLVSLFNFRGQQLLFPGDAQWGNWKSWLDQDDAETILQGVTFFKVAHHGSHNATPTDALDRMSKGKFAAMVSTQNVPWDSIPRIPLMDRLGEMTKNRVVRSDSLPLVDAPNAPKGPALTDLPKGFVQGDFWYDYLIKL
ncbi:MAG TPA: MBL fold metallo-hydrolase [Pyrinomonadaceae bacterium]|nr:MBL fold metallo-hydrolase [Pyrinomonadaceae bacterium]